MKKPRKIKLRTLLFSGMLYRINVLIVQVLFLYFLTGEWSVALKGSVGWLVIGTLVYYNYHYWFARLFKIGKDK